MLGVRNSGFAQLVEENNHLRGSVRLNGDTTALCEGAPSHEKRQGGFEPRNLSINRAGSCPTRGAERGTAGGDGQSSVRPGADGFSVWPAAARVDLAARRLWRPSGCQSDIPFDCSQVDCPEVNTHWRKSESWLNAFSH